jgi:hypothetical protein
MESSELRISEPRSILAAVEQSEVLDSGEMARLKALVPELQHAVVTRTIFRTPTEARFSVLNDIKFPTQAAKYHQSKLEQAVMLDNLIHLSFAYRRKTIDLQEVQARLKKAAGLGKQRLIVDRDELIYTLANMRKEAEERLRELEMWSQIKAGLDEEFDRDSKDTDQLQALALRYTRELPIAMRSLADTGGAVNIIGQAMTMRAECQRRGIALPEADLP